METFEACVLLVMMPSVCPSGAARAISSAPMLPSAPGPVVDHHRLAEILPQMLGDEARDEVRPGAGGEGDDHPQRAGRVILRGGGQHPSEQAQERQQGAEHGESSLDHGGRLVRPCRQISGYLSRRATLPVDIFLRL
jgi:hypothetical protein